MNKGMTTVLAAAFLLALSFSSVGERLRVVAPAAYAQENTWKTEFESICARTQDAVGMSSDELKNFVDRCDRLRPQIEKLDETQKKVYLKRLKMCRDLYAFVLETKEKK